MIIFQVKRYVTWLNVFSEGFAVKIRSHACPKTNAKGILWRGWLVWRIKSKQVIRSCIYFSLPTQATFSTTSSHQFIKMDIVAPGEPTILSWVSRSRMQFGFFFSRRNVYVGLRTWEFTPGFASSHYKFMNTGFRVFCLKLLCRLNNTGNCPKYI